ncbi:hypothetical protein CC1G_14892 [Coprinopsis cinerea okayama7|uniref:Uncharacterized protein n=1 Tax=Coprinopsis cinerea (strain Okayama-7 / 130 / ATCC MYA-4618 / FGSC 9003) TaxID=240176 RepID=D6RNK5_COPC7|nr:hypothetical protein CC1G_14892 [Coprinopsis cinerea okayama7\|eukprot:XP_002910915.1 hypothetical protein CC1G_14892 [Coprinopsis cinerea okayama7\
MSSVSGEVLGRILTNRTNPWKALFLCPRLPLAVSGVVVSSDHNHRGRTHLKKNFYPSKHDDDAIMRGMKQKKIRLPLCFHSCAKVRPRPTSPHSLRTTHPLHGYYGRSPRETPLANTFLSTSTFKFRNGVFSSTQDNPRELPHY